MKLCYKKRHNLQRDQYGKKYNTHLNKFKCKVVLEVLKEDKTVAELCQEYSLASSQIYEWKKKLMTEN